jgi:hypothetical protein
MEIPMSHRAPPLQDFLTSLEDAFRATPMAPEAVNSIDRIFAALNEPSPAGTAEPKELPVCDFLDEAFATARTGADPIVRLSDSLQALAPKLSWAPRPSGGPFASDNWSEGHANTMIVGPNGLEDRKDLYIGVSLLAPDVRYPDHDHGPEEVYLVLSPGRFQHGDSAWFEPGIGGTLYNLPNIKHAMASDGAPLLAIWCLWTEQPAH